MELTDPRNYAYRLGCLSGSVIAAIDCLKESKDIRAILAREQLQKALDAQERIDEGIRSGWKNQEQIA